jgi:hypothetical protein
MWWDGWRWDRVRILSEMGVVWCGMERWNGVVGVADGGIKVN